MISERSARPAGGDQRTQRRRAGRAERTKNGNSARANARSIGPSALDREDKDAQTSSRSGKISRGRLSVPRQWQYRQRTGSPRVSDASPWRLGPAVLAACGRLSRYVGLIRFPSQHPRQKGRSDLCSRHQRGSPGRSAWCVNRVTQPCRISQVCRQWARDAGLVALATAHTSPQTCH